MFRASTSTGYSPRSAQLHNDEGRTSTYLDRWVVNLGRRDKEEEDFRRLWLAGLGKFRARCAVPRQLMHLTKSSTSRYVLTGA